MMNRESFIMKNMREKMIWLKENTNYYVAGMFLQGSQNYDMDIYTDEYQSDIDVKVIIIPSFSDIVRGKEMISKVYVMDDNSHIEVKDIRLMINLWTKANPSYIELLHSKFKILSPSRELDKLIEMKNEISCMNYDRLLSCCKGMAYEKRKALCHPYPTIKDKIEKFGYDPKQLHHLKRMQMMIDMVFFKGISFGEALVASGADKELLLNLKLYPLPLDDAIRMADDIIESINSMSDKIRELNTYNLLDDVDERLRDEVYSVVYNHCAIDAIENTKASSDIISVNRIKSNMNSVKKEHKEYLKNNYDIKDNEIVEYDVYESIYLQNHWKA